MKCFYKSCNRDDFTKASQLQAHIQLVHKDWNDQDELDLKAKEVYIQNLLKERASKKLNEEKK